MAEQEYIICIRDQFHSGSHTFVPVGDAFNIAGKCCAKLPNGNTPIVTASELRELAQCALSAAVQLENNRLDANAQTLLGAWVKALPVIRDLTGEFHSSIAAQAARRAIGWLMRPQLARDAAAMECEAALRNDNELNERIMDADWPAVAFILSHTVIDAYNMALLKGQS